MEINLFRLCSGLKVIGYFMILLVAAIVAVSYYAVGVLTVAPHFKTNPLPSIFVTFIFHFLLVMLLWCYFMVVFTDPGSVPENWKPLMQEDTLETGLAGNSLTSSEITAAEASISTHSTDGQERRPEVAYCSRCRNAKPPRCHHCSVCQRCVLKMDHHCIWVVNCVGAANYKSFLLFLLYTFLETTMNTVVLLPTFLDFFSEAKTHATSPGNLAVIFVTFVLNLALSLSLLCFVVMHITLLSSNTTTIELHEKKRATRWTYDLGGKKNFEQVFGTKKALWFFPLLSKEDLDNIPALRGLEFPTVSDSEA